MCIVIAREISSLEYPCDRWDHAHCSWYLSVIIQQLLLMRQESGPRQLITGPQQQQWRGHGRRVRPTKIFTEKRNQTIKWLSRNWIVQCLTLVKHQSDINS